MPHHTGLRHVQTPRARGRAERRRSRQRRHAFSGAPAVGHRDVHGRAVGVDRVHRPGNRRRSRCCRCGRAWRRRTSRRRHPPSARGRRRRAWLKRGVRTSRAGRRLHCRVRRGRCRSARRRCRDRALHVIGPLARATGRHNAHHGSRECGDPKSPTCLPHRRARPFVLRGGPPGTARGVIQPSRATCSNRADGT